jgi:hypothetical protein
VLHRTHGLLILKDPLMLCMEVIDADYDENPTGHTDTQ